MGSESVGKYMTGTLAERITAFVVGHDADTRAAVRLVSGSVLLRKIAPYVDGDGWIAWDRLTGDLLDGLPWSSGEKRLARLACSLSGQMSYYLDEPGRGERGALVTNVLPWTLAELLYGLDLTNRAAALDAIHYAATGQPLPTTRPTSAPRRDGAL